MRQITINDLPVGRNVEETLRLVKAFQHADEHGDVRFCPSLLLLPLFVVYFGSGFIRK